MTWVHAACFVLLFIHNDKNTRADWPSRVVVGPPSFPGRMVGERTKLCMHLEPKKQKQDRRRLSPVRYCTNGCMRTQE
jgi:hypothetical protein